MTHPLEFFAPTARNISDLAETEAASCGAEISACLPGGVEFRSDLEGAYRFILHSRCASSLILRLGSFPIGGSGDLYDAARSIPWSDYFHAGKTIAVDAAGKRERAVEHTGFAAKTLKDAIADSFRDACGIRPSVDLEHPDVKINLFLRRKEAVIGIDLAGEPLHKRGYRKASGDSVLRETVAAALLYRAGWPAIAEMGGALFDPFCGSGTILIEAALMAYDIAPGLTRRRYGFRSLSLHEPELWKSVRKEAEQRKRDASDRSIQIIGSDKDSTVIRIAEANVHAAGLKDQIQLETADARFCPPPTVSRPGIVACDPPYGKRTTLSKRDLDSLYRSFGENLKKRFGGWQTAIIAGDEARDAKTGLKPDKINTLYNGSVECSLSIATIAEGKPSEGQRESSTPVQREELSPGAEMAANRLRKNRKRLKKWLSREGVTAYRVYDADMPEYSAAVDLYETCDGNNWLHVQEYAPPASIDPASAAKRLGELIDALSAVFQLPEKRIVVKQRSRQRGKGQYERMDERNDTLEIFENGLRFQINLHDYLDTGIFLDHRPIRLRIMESARGKRFLNLFAYTGTATVHAAAGAAVSSLTVDKSNTYLSWFEENMRLNGFSLGKKHRFLKADCINWLADAAQKGRDQFDLIFLDPPTFSNSKDMEESFDIQRDHTKLLEDAYRLLAPGGELIFSTNRRRFSLETELPAEEISESTIDLDFQGRRPPHRCWSITKE